MSVNFNTFIVSSTVNASPTIFNTENRYLETLETLMSIKQYAPTAKIVFIDNSWDSLSADQMYEINQYTNSSIYLKPNLFTRYTIETSSKSVGEAYMIYEALKFIKDNSLVGNRIFKLSGRYKLSATFDESNYNNKFYNKYAFLKHIGNRLYETRLLSFCSTLFDEFYELLPIMFDDMLKNSYKPTAIWGATLYQHLDKNKVVQLDQAHVEGWQAIPQSMNKTLYIKE